MTPDPAPTPAGPRLLPDADRLPTITTSRLQLRWLTPDDVPALLAVFGDPAVCRYWSRPALPDLAAAAALQREIAGCFAERSLFQWGVAERATNAVVGTCTLAQLSPEHRRAEVGYALARAVWGRGYLAEALPALLAFAFDTLGLHRVEADVDPRNAPSIRALERVGFRREGHLRERYHVAGEVQDAVLYGLLRREWAARPLSRAAPGGGILSSSPPGGPSMAAESHRVLIDRYLDAYNAFDVPAMLALLHPAVEFRNVANGEVNAAADGIAQFRELAERAATLFRSRRQTVTRYTETGDGAAIEVDYEGVLAADLSPTLRAGDTLRLTGQSTFGFRDGLIARIVDES